MNHSLSVLFAGVLFASSVLAQESEWPIRYLAGHRALEADSLEGARRGLESALLLEPEHAATAWALACVAAKEGNAEEAFTWLERVAEWGGADRALLEWDLDLKSLRDDPRFEALLLSWETFGDPVRTEEQGTPSWVEDLDPFRVSWSLASSDSERFWIATADGALRNIDVETGRRVREGRVSVSSLRSIRCGPRGHTICALTEGGALALIGTQSLAVYARHEVDGTARRRYSLTAYSPDESLLAVSHGTGDVVVLDVESGEVRWTGSGHEHAQRFSWSHDSTILLLQHHRKELLRLAFAESPSPISELHLLFESEVGAMGFQPGTSNCFVGTRGGVIHKIDARNGQRLQERSTIGIDIFGLPSNLGTIAFNSTGSRVLFGACGVSCSVMLDTEEVEILWHYAYRGGNPGAVQVAFSPDDSRVFMGSERSVYPPRTVEAETGKLIPDAQGFEGCSYWWLDRAGLALRKRGVGLQVCDSESGRELYQRIDTANGALLLSPSGHLDLEVSTLQDLRGVLYEGARPLHDLVTSLLDPKRVRAAAHGVVLRHAVIR